ncbi:MAG: ArsA family ATPase [Acidobacteria bacterium]|nr:ArsA family ATPase [Acidobacteriota bacterium]
MKHPHILLFTGKGGVGKTTIAAATAIRAADLGHRTLLMSADPAHSLSDALQKSLGPEPKAVEPNLYAQEIDVYYSIRKYWGALRDYVLRVFKWQKVDETLAEEFAALPGMEEGASFLWVEKFYREGEFDAIIIDSAPTGETLKLLSLPLVGQWWMERIFPIHKKVTKRLGPMVRAVTNVPIPEDETYEAVEDLYSKLLAIHEVLADPDRSAIRLVLNPERMVIQEASRMYTYLQLYGYPVDAAIVNRILPDDGSNTFRNYIRAQKRHLHEIEEAFAPLPIFRVPHLGQEVFGTRLLRQIGERLYEQKDPTTIFVKERSYLLKAQNGAYLLEIHLPLLQKGDVSVTQYGDELVIQVRNQRRNFFLPKFLAYYTASSARLQEGWLRVHFDKPKQVE